MYVLYLCTIIYCICSCVAMNDGVAIYQVDVGDDDSDNDSDFDNDDDDGLLFIMLYRCRIDMISNSRITEEELNYYTHCLESKKIGMMMGILV